MRKADKGFTLFEVLVSMFITGVALLGLALMEVHILKSSQLSFNYTVATIRANNFLETVWMNLCHAPSSTALYTNIRNEWIDEVTSAGMLTQADNPPASYAQSTSVIVSWIDPRFTDDASSSTVTLNAKFPDIDCGS